MDNDKCETTARISVKDSARARVEIGMGIRKMIDAETLTKERILDILTPEAAAKALAVMDELIGQACEHLDEARCILRCAEMDAAPAAEEEQGQ